MKRCRLSYDEWKCIKTKKHLGRQVNTDLFKGYVSVLEIEKVDEKQVWKFNGEDLVICDEGFKWLSILPQDDFYCITAMMNENEEILLWYIDMIADQGVDPDGVPYFDDLYLDLIVYPDGSIKEDDMDELAEALEQKEISEEQYQLAIRTGKRLKESLLSDINELKDFTFKCKELRK